MSDIEQHEQSVQLPFSPKKQDATLGHLLTNPRFFMQGRHRVKPGWFQDPIGGKVWEARLKFYEENKRIPTNDDLMEWGRGDFVLEDEATRKKMRHKVSIACIETANFGLDVISRELQGWLQAVLFKDSAGHAARLFNNQKFEEAYEFFDKKMDEIRTARFVDDGEFEWDNIAGDLEQEIKDRENSCTLGFELLDRTLLPSGTGGSLLPGDQTILLAATNGGKTRAMVTIIKHNIVRRKSVLWLVHEGRANDLAMLLWQAMLNCERHELFQILRTEDGRRRLDKARAIIKKYVTYVPYMKAGMVVEDVEPIIRNKCEERAAKNNGKTFDLFVSDYPAKLSTRLAAGGHMAPRHILDLVYNYHVNLAYEYRYHSLVAYQTNRAGAQVQKGHKEDGRLLTKEDASEAYGPMQTAANVITLNRPPELYAKGLVTWHFDKSRSGETGWSVCCKSDYGKSLTHAPWLGGIRYRGTGSMIEQMDVYMGQYFNGTVPEEIALG